MNMDAYLLAIKCVWPWRIYLLLLCLRHCLIVFSFISLALSENAGLLGLTRVGSRRVIQISTGFMFFFALLGFASPSANF